MTRNISPLAALVFGTLIGGAGVWWAVQKDDHHPASLGVLSSADAKKTTARLERTSLQASARDKTRAEDRVPVPSGSDSVTTGEARVLAANAPETAAAVTEKPPLVVGSPLLVQSGGAAGNEDARASMRRQRIPAPATVVDQVIVPVPSEVFAALEKVGRPRWKEVLRPLDSGLRPRPVAEETALLLGNVIAEGFIAVEAENAQQVKKVGQSVLNLSAAIGVRKTVMARSKAIMDSADRRNWKNVRTELDRALADVKVAMSELNSDTLADLVSLGGWLRGAEALSAAVKTEYSEEAAELLHQPALIEHFVKRLQGLPAKSKRDEIVMAMQAGVEEIRPLMSKAPPVGDKAVARIHEITGRLTKAIEGKNGR